MTKLISENLQSGLVVQGLRKSYQKKTIIQDVSLSVKKTIFSLLISFLMNNMSFFILLVCSLK